MTDNGTRWIWENERLLADANDTIWRYAETGLKEHRSSGYIKKILKEHGFHIVESVAGMDTAFTASWGMGKPAVGFLAEYDALPGLSQKVLPQKEPLASGDPGHGCGHNTLAAAILGGALGLKWELEQRGLSGTVLLFGCPAEELLTGKVRMAKERVFDGCDVLLSCHPNDVSYVWARSSNAVQSLTFCFHGVTSHAAIDPYNGRSALDAVELMDVGANYLREHMEPNSRLHYVITDGGQTPNVVPDRAEVWYQIRAAKNEQVKALTERVKKLAQGAATMTETSVETKVVSACSSVLRNRVLERLLLSCMEETGAPKWTDEEYRFATSIEEAIPQQNIRQCIREYGLGPSDIQQGLHTGIYHGLYREGETMAVSTDVGDASWIVPTGVFSFASTAIGSPGHSWYYTSCCGSTIAHKGAAMAACVLEQAGIRLMTDPELLKQVKTAFEEEKNGECYRCPLNFFGDAD